MRGTGDAIDPNTRRFLGRVGVPLTVLAETAVPPPRPPADAADLLRLRTLAGDIRQHTLDHLDAYLDAVRQAVERAGGSVSLVTDAADARRAVAAAGAARVVASPVCDEVGLTVGGVGNAVVVGAAFVVADTGQICLASDDPAVLGAVDAAVLVAVAGIEAVVPRAGDLAVMLKLLARAATGRPMTAYTVLIDPATFGRRLHLVMLDNGRSDLLAGDGPATAAVHRVRGVYGRVPGLPRGRRAAGRAVGRADRGGRAAAVVGRRGRAAARVHPVRGVRRRVPGPHRSPGAADRRAGEISRDDDPAAAVGLGGAVADAVPVGVGVASPPRADRRPAAGRTAAVVPRPVAATGAAVNLDRIRAAVNRSGPAVPPPHVYEPTARQVYSDVGLPELFAHAAARGRLAAELVHVEELPAAVGRHLRAAGLRRVVLSTSPVLRKVRLADALAMEGFTVVDDPTTAGALLSGADAAVAETGSLVFRGKPPVGWAAVAGHVVVLEPRDFVPDLIDLIGGGDGGLTLISGPADVRVFVLH